MLILHDSSQLTAIANPYIRQLAGLRFSQLESHDDPDAPDADGYFIVVEAGDAVSEIERATGFPILRSLFDDLPFGDPDFYPCTEILEEHRNAQICIYEMVFIGSDDGAFTCLLVPDEEGIDEQLLALGRSFATPAMTSP